MRHYLCRYVWNRRQSAGLGTILPRRPVRRGRACGPRDARPARFLPRTRAGKRTNGRIASIVADARGKAVLRAAVFRHAGPTYAPGPHFSPVGALRRVTKRALWGRRSVPGVAACGVLSCPNHGLRFYGGVKPVFRSAPVRNAGWKWRKTVSLSRRFRYGVPSPTDRQPSEGRISRP